LWAMWLFFETWPARLHELCVIFGWAPALGAHAAAASIEMSRTLHARVDVRVRRCE
jgi:hypothetical protein